MIFVHQKLTLYIVCQRFCYSSAPVSIHHFCLVVHHRLIVNITTLLYNSKPYTIIFSSDKFNVYCTETTDGQSLEQLVCVRCFSKKNRSTLNSYRPPTLSTLKLAAYVLILDPSFQHK